MEELYSAADFVIARSDVKSLTEFATFALPGILIPFPYAADDHQTRNTEIFVRAQAAVLVKESEISGDVLARHIRDLINNRQKLQRMSQNCSRLAPKDAASLVAAAVEKYSAHDNRS
jgi:UDP-N-acetylglucosamine--N-acetylmuramyl-(pentapeptide) pyrophosphoryl-undecaprenol N-acetylglucosamine transferase